MRWNLPWSFVCESLFSSANKLESTHIHWLCSFEIQAQKSFAVVLVCLCMCVSAPQQKHNVSVISLLLISCVLEAWFCSFFLKKMPLLFRFSSTDSLLHLSTTYCSCLHAHICEIEKTNISLLSACFSSKQFLKHDSSAP